MVEGKIEFTVSGRSSAEGNIAYTPSSTITKEPTSPEKADTPTAATKPEEPAKSDTQTPTATKSEEPAKSDTQTPTATKFEEPAKSDTQTPTTTKPEKPAAPKAGTVTTTKPKQPLRNPDKPTTQPVADKSLQNTPTIKSPVSAETKNKGIDKERTARNKNAAGDITYHKDGSVTISKRVDQRIEQMAQTLNTDSTSLKGVLFAESGFELNG